MSLIKEPFFHFALLGACIFAWFALANPQEAAAPAANEIVVTERLVGSLTAQYQAKLNRAPTPAEVETIIDRYVSNEIMVREARALGLDRGDGIVRNRLVQKMRFLTSSAAQSAVPDDATLEGYLQANSEAFERPAMVSFEQVSLKETVTESEAEAVLAALKEGAEPPVEMTSYILPGLIEDATETQVDGSFGRGVFVQITALPEGQWAGPVQSGYGLHLVRVRTLQPVQPPSLEVARDKVLADWRRSLAKQLTEVQEAALRENYVVVRPSEADIVNWLKP